MSELGFSLAEAARRIGHYRWIEMRLFEVLGRWVETVPELDVKAALGSHSLRHGWHAEVWNDRLPEVEKLTTPPNGEMEVFVDALSAPSAAELTIEKLVGVYRVLVPRVIATYSYHLAAADPIADAPTIRWLRFILSDEMDDWREGELLLQSLLRTGDDAARASAHHSRLEDLMVRAGGIAGPDSLGSDKGMNARLGEP